MKAAILTDTPGRLDITEVVIDKPTAREVLIGTVGSGLCHSDLHLIDGELTGFPTLLGHETAGVVELVGEDVTYVRPGDHVITFFAQFCGECEFCLKGQPVLCAHSPGARPAGSVPRLTLPGGERVEQFANLGGFAEQMLVHEHAVVKIDNDYPFDRAAIIGCGVASGMGAVFNTAAVRPGSPVAVVGCGGVGLSAIQGAVVAGARRIIAVDSQPAKFDLARALGATDCVDASAGDAVGQVMDLTNGGVDYSFEAIGLKATVEQCFEMLRPGGVATLIGIAIGQRAEFDVTMLLFGERKVQGSAMGSNRFRTDLPNFIELDQRGRIDLGAMIDEHIALGQINEGYEAMRRGAINGRKVIMFA